MEHLEVRTIPQGAGRPDRSQTISASCWIVGPVVYVIVLTVLSVMWPGYNPVRQHMSELGVINAPHALLMNVFGFQVLGISMVALALALCRALGRSLASLIGAALILLGGLSMVAVGFLPCDPGCINVSPTGIRHSITATIASIAMTSGMLVVSLRFRDDERWRGYWLFSLATAIVAILLSPLPMLSVVKPWAGVLQRLGIGIAIFWMVAVSMRMLRS